MKIIIDQRWFHETTKTMAKVADPKASLAALTCVRVTAKDGTVTVTATDLTQTITRTTECEGELDVCMFAKITAALTKPTKKGYQVEIAKVDGETIEVTVEGMTSRLLAVPVEEFPDLDRADAPEMLAALESKKVSEALAFVAPVASTDQTRPHINGVCFIDDVVVGTDGHRVHKHPLICGNDDEIVIPNASVKTLQAILKAGAVTLVEEFEGDSTDVRFTVGDWHLDTRVLDSAFPPYEQVIPKKQETTVTMDAGKLHKALKRMKDLGQGGIRMTVNGVIQLQSENPSVGDAVTVLKPIQNNHTGEDLVIGYNAGYMMEAVGKAGVVNIELAGDLDPLVVRHEAALGVVMPMRV